MPRVIFKCPYIKGGSSSAASHLGNYVRYMAARDGAQRIDSGEETLPATKKQREMVARLIRDFPLSRGMFEYEDFLSAPTRSNASEFITRALEDNLITGAPTQTQRSGLRGERRSSEMNELSAFAGSEGYAACDAAAKRENYVSYIASRPRAQRTGEHALFTDSSDPLVLSRIAGEAAQHPGNVWLPIISLRREDAARLGYDDAEQWRTLLSSYAMEMARAMKIPWEQFRWYAAFHDEGHHPHVHMVCYSADGKSGYLTKDGIAQIKSGLAKQIFRQELHELYEQQTQRRDALTQEAGAATDELIRQMQSGSLDNPRVEQLMVYLAGRLQNLSGKKQYGYLKAPLKSVVDEIVDARPNDPRVASAIDQWKELPEEVLRTYKNDLPERLPLSQQKEFKQIKNLVIREALRLNDLGAVFIPEGNLPPQEQAIDDIPGDEEPLLEEPPIMEDEPQKSISPDTVPPTITWSDRYRQARLFLFGRDAYPQDFAQAFKLFTEEASAGNALAMHDLGRMCAEGLGRARDETLAQEWYRKALNAFLTAETARPNRYVEYRIGKMYAVGLGTEQDLPAAVEWLSKAAEAGQVSAQYTLGKLLLQGKGIPKDVPIAVRQLSLSAEQGNPYAQYALGKLYLLGKELPHDRDAAARWFTLSAAQGNEYAQYFLDHMDDFRGPSVFACATRLLHHMARIFQEKKAEMPAGGFAMTDRKLRRRIQEKKIAMGHKADDHEATGIRMQ